MRFVEYLTLEEKLIMYQKGRRYGQVVFLAGGGGSGKGFSTSNFMEGEKFKIRDVDEWKLAFLKLSKLTGNYPEISDLDLRNPKDVFTLHTFVSKKNIKDKTLDYILQDAKNPETLPNIMFDVTLKDLDDLNKVIPTLISVGYKPENIHLTWILANFKQAAIANSQRARVVPEDILLATHTGAAKTMWNIIKNRKLPNDMDGEVRIVLNNREGTTFSGQKNSKGERIIVGFSYVTIKRSGKPFQSTKETDEKLKDWIVSNIPKTKDTEDIHSENNS